MKRLNIKLLILMMLGIMINGCSNKNINTDSLKIVYDMNKSKYSTYKVKLIKPDIIKYEKWLDIKSAEPILYQWSSDNLNAICREDKTRCWVDVNKTNYFTHDIEDLNDPNGLSEQDVGIKYSFIPNPPFVEKPKIYHDESLSVGKTIIRIPSFNTIRTVEIGENIYEKFNEFKYDTYQVSLNSSEILNDNKRIESILYKWTLNNLNTICRNDKTRCWIDLKNNNTFTHYVEDLNHDDELVQLKEAIPYTLKITPSRFNENSFKYEALYQGKIGNKIKISFREFKNDMARAAFTQDIEYELEKNGGSIIGFKGLRVKVLKATNTNITYSVLQDYN